MSHVDHDNTAYLNSKCLPPMIVMTVLLRTHCFPCCNFLFDFHVAGGSEPVAEGGKLTAGLAIKPGRVTSSLLCRPSRLLGLKDLGRPKSTLGSATSGAGPASTELALLADLVFALRLTCCNLSLATEANVAGPVAVPFACTACNYTDTCLWHTNLHNSNTFCRHVDRYGTMS